MHEPFMQQDIKGDDLMGDRIMRCEKCNKQTVHVREGKMLQIRNRIELFFRCSICGESVRLLAKKPRNPPRGVNWRSSY